MFLSHKWHRLHIAFIGGLLLVVANACASVEFPVWQRHYTGTIAGKAVDVHLSRTDNTLNGSYCYAPCNSRKFSLLLSGSLNNDASVLQEKGADELTGIWNVTLKDDQLQGNWTAPDKKRTWPISLTLQKAKNDPSITLSLVADAMPPASDAQCSETPTVSEIKLYKDGALLQTLATESTGTCNMFLPEWEDVNFDGYPDLSIAQFLPAGPNIPRQTWLYDPQQRRFIDAPADYQEITSPDRDEKYQHIVSFWRGSCCSHGVNVYRWQDKHVVLVEQGESYMQPILAQGKMLSCYVIPDYQEGRVTYPLKRVRGELTPWKIDKNDACDPLTSVEQVQTVIQPDKPGDEPEILPVSWQADKTHPGYYCPVVPFFDGRKIVPRQVTNNDVNDVCMDEEAWKAFNAP